MPALFPFVQHLVPLCLAAALLWSGTGRPALAAGDATLVFNACGALLRQPGLGDPWPGGKAVRPGETLLPGDKGLGCRFTLTGEPAGAAVVVTVRLTRPGPDGAPVDDHWFVPVRRGEAAAAVYGFAPGQPAAAGPWSLTLTADGAGPVTARFDAPAPVGEPEAAGLAGSALPAAAGPPLPAPKTTPVTVQTVTPLPPPLVGEATAPTVAAPEAAAIASAPAAGSPASAARRAEAPLSPPAAAMPQVAPAKTQPAAAAKAKPADPPPAKAPAPAPAKPAATGTGQTVAQTTAKAAAPAGYVALQTGLFTDADNAAVQAAKLRARGMPACVAVTETAGKRRYRVLAGRFGDKRAAGEARAAVTAILGLSPLLYAVDAAEVARLRCR